MKTRWLVPVLLVSSTCTSLLRAQTYHAERGATLGGIGGALAGAAIGKHNGETAAGALIGGAVGLLGGAAIGNSMDEKARAQAYQQQQQMYQQQQYERLSRAVSTSDVLTMTRNGLSDDVIANHIRENGVQRKLEVSDVIMLHKNGVSEAVITSMQNAPIGTAAAPAYAAPAPAPAPAYGPARQVIVQEHYYAPAPIYWHGPPPGYWGHHHHHHFHPAPPRTRVTWGMSYGF